MLGVTVVMLCWATTLAAPTWNNQGSVQQPAPWVATEQWQPNQQPNQQWAANTNPQQVWQWNVPNQGNTWAQPQAPVQQQAWQQPQGNTNDIIPQINDIWPVNNDICNDGEVRKVLSSTDDNYEVCVNGRWVAQSCAPGTKFNSESMSCTDSTALAIFEVNASEQQPQEQQPNQVPQPQMPSTPWMTQQNIWQQQPWQQAQWQQPQQNIWQQWQPNQNVWQQPNVWQPKVPAPVTPSPMTPAPMTQAPMTPAPMTPAPMTPAPMTPAPMTPAPMTPAPMTPAPMTPAPMTPAPMTPAPMTPAPMTPAPTPAPTKKPHYQDPWFFHAQKCKSGSRRSVDGNNDAFEVCDNGEWVFMLCAPGTWFDTEFMECSDGYGPAPAWAVPKNMVPMVPLMKDQMKNMNANTVQEGSMDQMMEMMVEMMEAENKMNEMMALQQQPMMVDNSMDSMMKDYANPDMQQQIIPEIAMMPESMQIVSDNMHMIPDNMQIPETAMIDAVQTPQVDTVDNDLWLNDVREVIIVSVEKCKVGGTREDASAKNYQECIMNPYGTTMWIRRKCAPGTLFSPWTRNCGKVSLRYNDTDPWMVDYLPKGASTTTTSTTTTTTTMAPQPTMGTTPSTTQAPATQPPTVPTTQTPQPTQPTQPATTPGMTQAPTMTPMPTVTEVPMKMPYPKYPWMMPHQMLPWNKGNVNGVKKDPKSLTITFELKNNGAGYYA